MVNKFVVFSQTRSGSTLLQGLLDSHSKIHCEGEILTLTDEYISNGTRFKYLNNDALYQLCKLFPIPYVYIRRLGALKPVYGCFLFIFHTPFICHTIQTLYKLNWKIIYLEREDIINQSLSNIIALQTGYFVNRSGINETDNNFVIDVDRFLKTVKNRLRWHNNEKKCLEGIKFTRISYEDDLMDLVNRQKTMNLIFDLLSLEHEPAETKTIKTYSKPYSEIVKNYDELMSSLEKNGFHELLKVHRKYNY